jgi:hypothetical protein
VWVKQPALGNNSGLHCALHPVKEAAFRPIGNSGLAKGFGFWF